MIGSFRHVCIYISYPSISTVLFYLLNHVVTDRVYEKRFTCSLHTFLPVHRRCQGACVKEKSEMTIDRNCTGTQL